MTINNPKQEILQSLNGLDDVQFEKVLGFIRDLLPEDRFSARYRSNKRQAMNEINHALRQKQILF